MWENILNAIEQADDGQISEVIQAVIRRYNTLFPDWETIFLSLPKKDIDERRSTLERAVKMLLEEKFCELNEIHEKTL